jgi:hypothetical protein
VAAIATVLFLAMLHAPSPSKDATVGRADALAKAERMVAQQRWSDAVAVALQYLAQYPEERRLRFVLSQSLAGLGNADQALLHLSMAATPPAGADSRVALGSPSREEVWQALRQLEADHDAQLTSDWAHFRKARVAAFCGQFEKRDIELSAISRGARQSSSGSSFPLP